MPPKVSVIIPVYNVEKYIRDCLDSVFAQTLDGVEVICVDDGSTDATAEILADYAAHCPNLTVEHQQNAGSSVARNRALDRATGEYISFVDSDDRYTRPDALKLLYARAKALDVDELFFNACGSSDESYEQLNVWTTPTYHFAATYPQDRVLDGRTMFATLKNNDDYMPYIWRRLYRRSFLEEHRLRFIEGIVHQDYMFTIECTALARRSACCDLVCYDRHLRGASITTSRNYQKTVYARCVGTIALKKFFEPLRDGSNPEFERAFLRHIGEWERENANYYLNFSRAQRRAFRDSIPEAKRAEIWNYFAPVVRRRRLPHLLHRIHRSFGPLRKAVKRRVSPELWARIKGCKDRLLHR